MAVQRPIRSRGVLISIIALSGLVVLAAMGRARSPEKAATDVHLETTAHAEDFVIVPDVAVAETAATKVPAPTPTPTPAPAPVAAPAAESPLLKATEVVAPLPHTVIASPEVVTTRAASVGATTITGCLAFDAGTYRLKDATGMEAPKSRSWKSGFLRKRSATLDVIDAGGLGLPKYVGQRVEVTGTLDDREIQARSLHWLAQSCKK